MKRQRDGICIPVLCGVVILLSLVVLTAIPEQGSAAPHSPISINGNADFTPANGVTGGSGTPEDPYVIEGWEIDASTADGVYIRDTDASFVIRNLNVTSGVANVAIYLYNVTNGRVENVTVSDAGTILSFYAGVQASYSRNITIQECNISNSQQGLFIVNSYDITAVGNRLHGNSAGLTVALSANVTVGANHAFDNLDGMRLSEGPDITIRGNNASSNSRWGILVSPGAGMILERNDVNDNGGDGFYVQSLQNSSVISNNVSFNQGHGIYAIQPVNLLVEDNNASSNGKWGILIDSPTNATVGDNHAADNVDMGIGVTNSQSSAVALNEAHGNGGTGLHLNGLNLTVESNNVSNNNVGISVGCCQDYAISRNRVWENVQDGIRTLGIGNVTVSGNDVWSNGQYGIFLSFTSTGHTIYHNNLVNNTVQAYDLKGPENAWSAPYPTGGNYWSDHSAVDVCSGPDQDICPDADGFGDSAYVVDANTRDPYPLVGPIDHNNTFPTASYVHLPDLGNTTTKFTLNASSSYDAEDSLGALEFRWDWEGDWAWDTNWSTETETAHVYGVAGRHTTRLMVRDTGGLLNTTTREIVTDGTSPITSATLSGVMGQNGWFRSSVSVTLTATDALTGVESTEYRVDDGPWQYYTTPFDVSGEGTHSVDYRSTDEVGNSESPKTTDVRIDTIAPVTAIELSGTVGLNGWFVSAVNVTLTANDSTSGLSSTAYRTNGGSWVEYTGLFPLETGGVTTLEFYSIDIAGNEESFQQSIVKIDLQSPDLVFLAPPEGSWLSETDLTVLWNGSDEASGVDRYEVDVDGGPVQVLTEGRLDLVGLAEGTHAVRVVVFDRAGHSKTFVHNFGVDLGSPAVTVVSPSADSHHVQRLVMVEWEVSDTLSGVATCFVSWDGREEVSVGGVSSYTFELSDGAHDVVVRCIDLAGNSGEATLSLSVDTSPFSPSGPYGPWLLVALIAIPIASGLAILLWHRRTRETRPPKAGQ